MATIPSTTLTSQPVTALLDFVLPYRNGLFRRIKNISNKSHMHQQAIEANLIEFSESKGIDMTIVRAAMERYYHKPENCSPSDP